MNSFKSLCFLLLVLFVSCSKDETTSLYDNTTTPDVPLQLIKIGSWNSVSGMETVNTEFIYATDGRLGKIFFNKIALAPTYNAAGKVSLASGVNDKGGVVSYTFEYNALGQIVKVVHVFMNPTDLGYTRTFTYNAAGKIAKITTLSAVSGSTATTIEYTWKGDNIESSTYSNATTNYVNNYTAYDDKLNPYRLANSLAATLLGVAVSKNNYTESTTTYSTGTVYLQKRSYTYNSSGYALNISLSDGGNELTRFYYNK